MPRKNSIFNAKNTKKQQQSVCVVVVVVLILTGLFFYLKKNNMLRFMGIKEGFESSPMELNRLTEKPNPDDNTMVVLLFYVDWCPHCVSTKPEWKKLEALNGNKINNKTVEVKAVNCEGSAVEKEVANDVGVEGYPTIKVMTKNNVEDYNGARDENSIKEHINNASNN